jgi:hypothetical protein
LGKYISIFSENLVYIIKSKFMKITFSPVSALKYTDMGIQAFTLIVALLLCFYAGWGPFAFMTEAAVQVMSSLCWTLYFGKGIPAHQDGVFIRRAFLITAAVWIAGSVFSHGLAAAFLLVMMFLGPVMGIAYFAITLIEARYYGKARKPFYLL